MTETAGDGALRPKTKVVKFWVVGQLQQQGANRIFHLRRPGFGGLSRLATRLARSASDVAGYEGSRVLDALFGGGIEMASIVGEYLVRVDSSSLPTEGGWMRKPEAPGCTPGGDWNLEAVDPAEMAVLGREALVFHRTFSVVDSVFGLIGSPGPDLEAGVGDTEAVPPASGD